MAKNEQDDEYPEGLIDNATKQIEGNLGLRLISNYQKYIYLDGRYGDKSARKYAKEFSASITGETKATKFRNERSYEANKIFVDEEKKYVVFLSPMHGGENIFR